MYTKTKKALCVMLAVLVCFCACANVLTQPAEAATPIAIAVGAAAAWVLGMMGIQFASMQAANDAAGAFYNSDATVAADLETVAATFVVTEATTKFPLTAAILPVVLRLIAAAKEFFGANTGNVSVPTDFAMTADNIVFTTNTSFASPEALFMACSYNALLYSSGDLALFVSGAVVDTFDIDVNGVKYSYSFRYQDNNEYSNVGLILNDFSYVVSYDGNDGDDPNSISTYRSWAVLPLSVCAGLESIRDIRFGFSLQTYNEQPYLVPYLGVRYINNQGIICHSAGFPTLNKHSSASCIPVTGVYTPVTDDVDYSKLGISIETLTAAIDGLKATIGDIALDISDLYNSLTDTAEGTQEGEQEQTVPYIPSLEWLKKMLLDMGVTADLINKITAGATETENPAGSIDEVDPDVPTLPDLTDKFPFCIPFDLIALVTSLNAKAVCPRFEVPIDMEFVNYHDTLVIDFAPFEPAAAVIRWGTTIFFILGLIVVTRKMIQA